MLDVFDIPTKSKAVTNTYVGGVSTISVAWQKPRGTSMVRIVCIGGGGGGGAGGPAGALGASGGGGGGGSGAQWIGLFPVWALPNTLYIQPGSCGLGGTTADGTAGGVSRVMVGGTSTVVQEILITATAGGGGQVGRTTTGFNTGGAGGAASTIANATISSLAFNAGSLAGQDGTNAGVAFNGEDITLPTIGLVVTGGTAGGGLSTSFNNLGGSFIVPTSYFPAQPGGKYGGTTTASGGAGSNGFKVPNLLYFYGGTGGAPSGRAGGNGGRGGIGAYGCGGGGGGGTFTGGVRAVGGNGGAGIIIITSW